MNRISTVHALWIGIYIYNKILICGGFLKQKTREWEIKIGLTYGWILQIFLSINNNENYHFVKLIKA